jgi:hypothetical protein
MDDVMVLINQTGPLPITVTFNAPADGPVSFFLSGSGWTQHSGTGVWLELALDGVKVASSGVYANNASVHLTTVPVFAAANLAAGEHSLTLNLGNPTTLTDANDYFHVSLHL